MKPPQDRRRTVYKMLQDSISGLLEAIVFNVTLKIVVLRLLLIAILVNMYIQILNLTRDEEYDPVLLSTTVVASVLFFFIHVASFFTFCFIPRWLDLLLHSTQIAYLFSATLLELPPLFAPIYFSWIDMQWLSLSDGFSAISCLGIYPGTVFLFLCRIAAVIRYKGKNLREPFNFLEARPRAFANSRPANAHPQGLPLIFGRSLWRKQFLGEGLCVRLLRGFIAGCLVVAFVAYGIVVVLIQPALELEGFIPVKQMRTNTASHSRVFLPDPWDKLLGGVQRVIYVVVPVANDTSSSISNLDQLSCDYRHLVASTGHFQSNPCGCTGRRSGNNVTTFKIDCDAQREVYSRLYDIVIDVTFGQLGVEMSDSVTIYVSLANIDAGSTDATGAYGNDPAVITLTSGVDYLAAVSFRGRKTLDGQNQATSYFGIFESPKYYLIPSLQYVIRDPSGGSPNRSTLRLSTASDFTDFRFEADIRENTVFSGIATMGGLFTFLSGFFTFIFGTTILRIFFDMKELSMFGLAQRWDRKKIVKAYLDEYPQLREQLELDVSQRGIVAVLQDHLVDMKLFKEVLEAERRSASNIELVTKAKDEEEEAGLKENKERNLVQGEEDEAAMFLPGGSSNVIEGDISVERTAAV